LAIAVDLLADDRRRSADPAVLLTFNDVVVVLAVFSLVATVVGLRQRTMTSIAL
jgi:hypothetical protein